MENDRIKFTYRYTSDIDRLLKEALKKFGITSLNKLIDKLIFDALVNQPKEIKSLKTEIAKMNKDFSNLGESNRLQEKTLKDLKSLIKQEYEIKDKINKILLS